MSCELEYTINERREVNLVEVSGTVFCVTFQQSLALPREKSSKIGTNFKAIVPCTVKKLKTGVYLSPMNLESIFADKIVPGDASFLREPQLIDNAERRNHCI